MAPIQHHKLEVIGIHLITDQYFCSILRSAIYRLCIQVIDSWLLKLCNHVTSTYASKTHNIKNLTTFCCQRQIKLKLQMTRWDGHKLFQFLFSSSQKRQVLHSSVRYTMLKYCFNGHLPHRRGSASCCLDFSSTKQSLMAIQTFSYPSRHHPIERLSALSQSLAAAEVPQLDSFVVRPGHNDAVTELQARNAIRVIAQCHESLTSCQAPHLQHTSTLNYLFKSL